MRKIILAICLSFMLMFAVPVMAGHNDDCPPGNPNCNTGGDECCPEVDVDINGNIQGAIGEDNVGIQNTGTMDNVTVNTGDDNSKTGFNDNTITDNNTQLGIQDGNKNTAINGDNTGDIDNSDNSILKNADLTDSQNGLVNQKGHDNQQGLANQKGHHNQQGLLNQAGSGVNQAGLANQNGTGNQMGLINLKGGSQMGLVNVKGSGNQAGIQVGANNNAVNGDNNGVIVQQVNSGGNNNYPVGINSETSETSEGYGGGGGSGGNNNVNAFVDNSVTTVEDKREFLAQPMITFSTLGEYKEGRDMGANFQTVEMLTMFKKVFSYDAAFEDYGRQYGESKCRTIGHSYNGRHEDNPSKEIKVFTLNDKIDPSTVTTIGFLTVLSVDKKVNSFLVLQKAVLSACLMQGDAIIVTKQGAETTTKSSGWGIGFNTSGGSIAEDDGGLRAKSATGSGGTGYSSGKANLETYSWLIVQVLKFK